MNKMYNVMQEMMDYELQKIINYYPIKLLNHMVKRIFKIKIYNALNSKKIHKTCSFILIKYYASKKKIN